DAGAWFGRAFAGEPVPTLDEAVECVRGRVGMNLELKGDDAPCRLEILALGTLRSLRYFDQTVFSSFSVRRMRALRDLSPEARIGILLDAGGRWQDALALAHELEAE